MTVDHVLFLVADQWRGDTLGQFDTPGVVTPHLDALAADGVTFTSHFCLASPCGPSRRSIHTGTGLATHGQWTNDGEQGSHLPTLAATVRQANIRPWLVGYTDTPQPGHDRASWETLVDPAFDIVQPFVWQQGFPFWKAELARHGQGDGGDHAFGPFAPAGEPSLDGLAPAHYRAEHSDVRFLTEAAIAAMGADDRQLMHVNWLRPHPPMTAPDPWHRLVDPADVALPPRPSLDEIAASHPYFAQTIPGRSLTEYTQQRSQVEDLTEQTERHVRAAYYGLCGEVDEAVGHVISELKRLDRYESTLIVFTSDHGESLGDHWIWGRRGPYDGHLSVPCIVRDPRAQADCTRGTRVDALTGNHDLYATICHALGTDVPTTVEGRTLVPFMHGQQPSDWRDHISFAMSWADHVRADDSESHRLRVIRTATHRLVTFAEFPPLLHDLVEDPHEMVNRASDPTLGDRIEQLRQLS